MTEVQSKLRTVRDIMQANGLSAVRLKGVDWFSWITGGGSSVVILTSETGAGEVLVTAKGAWVLTDAIERTRFRDEEVPQEFEVWSRPWEAPRQTDMFVREHGKGGRLASDRPSIGEIPLPPELMAAKRRLLPEEIERYHKLGADAALAMTEVLQRARPEWTEQELAGEGARAMWARGIHPTLTLAAGDERAAKYRHPFPSARKLGDFAMLVFCGRRHGLYANLTRWVYFREPTADERSRHAAVARVEAVAFAQSAAGARLQTVYHSFPSAYEKVGFPGEYLKHHQGGTTGYLAREVVATPTAETRIEDGTALAWNPSVPGAKIEDTVVRLGEKLEILTVDPQWPTTFVDGRNRPDVLVRP